MEYADLDETNLEVLFDGLFRLLDGPVVDPLASKVDFSEEDIAAKAVAVKDRQVESSMLQFRQRQGKIERLVENLNI